MAIISLGAYAKYQSSRADKAHQRAKEQADELEQIAKTKQRISEAMQLNHAEEVKHLNSKSNNERGWFDNE